MISKISYLSEKRLGADCYENGGETGGKPD
ncbi:MAG: hypothetical protein PWQ63_442 [Methanolobus sp.]|jgi:hypothetical protein|nr:hypothetical protein [Methanolobus sp.]MDK2947282.1 hypothetical protein [Methanolobus sp.]